MSVAEIKRLVRERDGFQCVECGITNEEHRRVCGRGLEVHRTTPGVPYSLQSSITLCGACHKKKPKSRRGKSVTAKIVLDRKKTFALLGVNVPDDFNASKFLLRLLQTVPRETSEAILAQSLEAKSKTTDSVRLPRHFVAKAKFIAAVNGISVTEYLDSIMRPILTARHDALLEEASQLSSS